MDTPTEQTPDIATLPELYDYITNLAKHCGDYHALRTLIYAGSQVRLMPRREAISYLNEGFITTQKTKWVAAIAGIFEYNAKKTSICAFYYPHLFDDNCYATPWWFPDPNERLMWFYFQYTPPELKSRGVFLDRDALECL